MDYKDYYRVLGVERGASADAIKKAYRRLARQYHPDVSKEPDAAQRMAEVNEAHEVLGDVQRRAAYDALGTGRHEGEAFTPPPDWAEGFEFTAHGPRGGRFDGDFSDFFEQLFGRAASAKGFGAGAGGAHGAAGFGGFSGHGARPARGRGADHQARIGLSLADLYQGGLREVTLREPRLSPEGQVALHERTLQVKIPQGLRPGQVIRLAGQGSPGQGGEPAGDLLLEVTLQPHPRFAVRGADLLADLPVAPWEAALGAVVPVTLPDGQTLKVRVPAGAQGGQALTVRGKGLPGAQPGDLELLVRIWLPSAMDPRARQHYEAMARELPDFDARRVAEAESARSA